MNDATKTPVTRAIAGERYLKSHTGPALTHSIVEGEPKTLCKRIKEDSILDDSCATDENAAPTCPVCAKRDPRFAV